MNTVPYITKTQRGTLLYHACLNSVDLNYIVLTHDEAVKYAELYQRIQSTIQDYMQRGWIDIETPVNIDKVVSDLTKAEMRGEV